VSRELPGHVEGTPRARKRTPVYDLDGWRLVTQDVPRLVYRPGLKVLLRRLGWTALAALAIYGVYAAQRSIAAPAPRESAVRREESEALRREVEAMRDRWAANASAPDPSQQRETARQRDAVERIERMATGVAQGLYVLFGVLGVLAPASCLWRRVIIAGRSPQPGGSQPQTDSAHTLVADRVAGRTFDLRAAHVSPQSRATVRRRVVVAGLDNERNPARLPPVSQSRSRVPTVP